MLDSQIQIYSVDTGNFYSKREAALHELNHNLRVERNQLIKGGEYKRFNHKSKIKLKGIENIEKELFDYGLTEHDLRLILDYEYDYAIWNDNDNYETIITLADLYIKTKELIAHKSKLIKESKTALLKLLENKINANISSVGKHHIRELQENNVSEKDVISVFESSFTRMISAKKDELCEDFMVVQVYYFDILKDLIYYGFEYKGEKYIYFTSSAGQIRTKKALFIKETVWNKFEKTIMCGLTISDINAKGGNNPNKHLAYMALSNSATEEWTNKWGEFDIEKTIVVDDFETNVFGEHDFIDEKDYSITRKSDFVPIPHTDGCGMILPFAFGVKQRNVMVRLPWVKGLLGVFDYVKFIQDNNCSSVIKDIYGVEHDVIKENIQIIFTKSQFKLWKYYDSYEQYKEYYKKYNCSAGITNPEEERIKDATINYQMLQSLTDITDDEILAIADKSISTLNEMCDSIDKVKRIFGITSYAKENELTELQQAIQIYPELLNDVYIRNKLKEIKDSLVKHFKAGKLKINGKYTFLMPDLYAFCEFLFLHIAEPKGLLNNNEVFCWLYHNGNKHYNKVDCLRSPHLYREHAVKINVAHDSFTDRQQQIREWFITDAIYTSTHDLISKVLQFDVDGDKALVICDKTFILVVERNMQGIVPLYYNMAKALPSELSNQKIYDSLIMAFTSGNIGQYSNNISKIWNNEVFISGSEEDKQHALNCIKRLCCQNNFVIDVAKTLYKPDFPMKIRKEIKEFTKLKLPHFFIYAKDKEEKQVSEVNDSFVNKLNSIIPNPRISCKYIDEYNHKRKLKEPDCKLLMSDPNIVIIEETNPVVQTYIKKAKEYWQKINPFVINDIPRDSWSKTQLRKIMVYDRIVKETKIELSQLGYSDKQIVDILVLYLYGKKSKYKDLLWTCYGEIILDNLKNNYGKRQTKDIQCVDCGEWFEVDKSSRIIRCPNCYKNERQEHNRIMYNNRKSKITK